MMKWLTHNFYLKILSLGIAVILWLLVTRGVTNF